MSNTTIIQAGDIDSLTTRLANLEERLAAVEDLCTALASTAVTHGDSMNLLAEAQGALARAVAAGE